MPAAVEDVLRHDAASLAGFVKDVSDSTEAARAGIARYPSPSTEFLSFVDTLAHSTEQFLARFPTARPRHERLYGTHRQKLFSIRSAWDELHQFIKPTADAHTLEIPTPLIDALTARFNLIKDFERTRFAVFHLDELNYMMIGSAYVQRLADDLASLVGAAERFPTGLGLIGVPYSQGRSLFSNLLIAHEMGHYLFENANVDGELLPFIESAINDVIGTQWASVGTEEKTWLRDRLAYWAEEVFCDLVAVWLAGPCYTFAYIELFDLAVAARPGARVRYEVGDDVCEFSDTHPADLFRIKQQAVLLDGRLGWRDHLKTFGTHYVDVIDASRRTPESRYFAEEAWFAQLFSRLPAAFFRIVDPLHRIVGRLLDGVDSGAKAFQEHNRLIEAYFHEGLVPSTLVSRRGTKTKTEQPTPLAVINTCYKVYLRSLGTVMGRVKDVYPTSVAHRVQWASKLENWALKAIEDCQLLEQRKP
jgi:hypothetical protein